MNNDIYDSEWIKAVTGAGEKLRSLNIQSSDRDAVLAVSTPIWEQYMLQKGHHGNDFAQLSIEMKVARASEIKSPWMFIYFYVGVLMYLNQDRIVVNFG